MKVEQAKQIIAQGDGRWDGPKRIIRFADKSKRGTWEKLQSGIAGPMVMQLT